MNLVFESSERLSNSPGFSGPVLPPDPEPRVLGGTLGILAPGFGLSEPHPSTNVAAIKSQHDINRAQTGLASIFIVNKS